MAKKKVDEDDFDDLDDALLDDEPNESNLEASLVPRDYSNRKILLLELDNQHRTVTLSVLRSLLTGAHIRAVGSVEEALRAMDEEDWDTYVVDLQEVGVSVSRFVKRVNNLADAMLVAIPYGILSAGDENNRLKFEPLRRLFDVEKPKPKA